MGEEGEWRTRRGRTVGFFPDALAGLCVEPVGPSLWVAVLGLKEVRTGGEDGRREDD